MGIYFSNSIRGFYDDDFHSEMPNDAIKISEEVRSIMLAAQQEGKAISVNSKGEPIFSEHPLPSDDRLSEISRLKRDTFIAQTDHLLMSDYPISEDLLVRVKAYRQLLRDITEQAGFPTDIDWPINPMEA